MYAVIELLGAVVNTLWQAVLVCILVKVTLGVIPRTGAATRHAIWWLTLAAVLLLPFDSNLFSSGRPHPQPSRSTRPQTLGSRVPHTMPDHVFLRVTPAPTALWPRIVLCAWTAILLWRFAQILRSYLYLGGIKRRARPAGIVRAEIPRSAAILVSSEIVSPLAIGFLPPAIVLPECMLSCLETAELDHVLLHETAHLARYDDWTNLLQWLLSGALALHPAVIWVLGQIEREREIACDDWVVSRIGAAAGAARSYAESLVHLMDLRQSRLNPALAVGVVGRSSRLRRRIEILVRPGRTFSSRVSYLGSVGSAAGLTVLLFAGSFAPRWTAWAGQPPVPQWQTRAGGKLAFDVASVKLDQGRIRAPGYPLDDGDSYKDTGDRFSATFPLLSYIRFAYKIDPAPDQARALHLPEWARNDRFAVEAKAPIEHPTKDQMRLMMQSLLADRFHLAIHFEIQTSSVLALRLVRPGRLGPRLIPHSAGPPCDVPPSDGTWPPRCETYGMNTRNGTRRGGSRKTTLDRLATAIPSFGALTRPVVDQTGLEGEYDFILEWTPESTSPGQTNPNSEPPSGPSFFEALKEQLGLKLVSTKAPIQALVIDHVEEPSRN